MAYALNFASCQYPACETTSNIVPFDRCGIEPQDEELGMLAFWGWFTSWLREAGSE